MGNASNVKQDRQLEEEALYRVTVFLNSGETRLSYEALDAASARLKAEAIVTRGAWVGTVLYPSHRIERVELSYVGQLPTTLPTWWGVMAADTEQDDRRSK